MLKGTSGIYYEYELMSIALLIRNHDFQSKT